MVPTERECLGYPRARVDGRGARRQLLFTSLHSCRVARQRNTRQPPDSLSPTANHQLSIQAAALADVGTVYAGYSMATVSTLSGSVVTRRQLVAPGEFEIHPLCR